MARISKNEVTMAKKIDPEEAFILIEKEVPVPPPVVEELQELPTKIKFNEFLSGIQKAREFLPETVGGFIAWMKREGVPKSLPYNRWRELLVEYTKRKT